MIRISLTIVNKKGFFEEDSVGVGVGVGKSNAKRLVSNCNGPGRK